MSQFTLSPENVRRDRKQDSARRPPADMVVTLHRDQ
jgi:hypothetical protein